MRSHRLRCGSVLAALLGALGATAAGAGDIVQCVDQQGRVTLTDAPCVGAVQSIVTTGLSEQAAASFQEANRTLPLARMLARDVETLKAARVSMRALDAASAALAQRGKAAAPIGNRPVGYWPVVDWQRQPRPASRRQQP